MHRLPDRYRPSLSLLTDFYELTMAYGYFKTGWSRLEASFALSFRQAPFGGGYAVACGIEDAIAAVESIEFDGPAIDWLRQLASDDGRRYFDEPFLEYLRAYRFDGDLWAVPEGTVVFPHEPLIRVTGPLLGAQLVESLLLNVVNFQTLIATKATRVVRAARGEPVLEFGLRRAQGPDGALSASRAAWVGGCSATSNTLAGMLFGIPVRGTHAHSWVMAFDDEVESFVAWVSALPGNTVLLVDTYDTIRGVEHAIVVGRELARRGHRLQGIRLDSGDLAWLSARARSMLDAAGLTDTVIYASDDLDETAMERLRLEGAAIAAWGVGTHLVTAHDQPALGGVYKMTAIRKPGGTWEHRVKLSEQVAKTSIPGLLQVRRYRDGERAVADAIYDAAFPPADGCVVVDPGDATRQKRVPGGLVGHDLLVPVLEGGRRVRPPEPLADVRDRVTRELASLDPSVTRAHEPHPYPAGLEQGLHRLRERMILRARAGDDGDRTAAPHPGEAS